MIPSPPEDKAPPIHGTAGVGGALLLTGDRGDRARLELAADVKLGGRIGVLAAWRASDPSEKRYGLVTAGVVFEAGAARPRLVLDLHADVGADLDARAPVLGGGIRTTLTNRRPARRGARLRRLPRHRRARRYAAAAAVERAARRALVTRPDAAPRRATPRHGGQVYMQF